MKKIVFMFVFLMMTASRTFAQEAPTKQETVHVKPSKEGGTYNFPAPAPGENLTVIVDQQPSPALTPVTKNYVTNVTQQGFSLRGGLTAGVALPGRAKSSFTGGLIGEIGHADSLWRLQGTFRAGNCKNGDSKGVALNSGLAAMGTITENFRAGIGTDLLYCSDVSDHPKEKASKRIVGGSLRLEFVDGRFSVAGSIGMGAATIPTPGDRETKAVLFGGVNVSYLWGK